MAVLYKTTSDRLPFLLIKLQENGFQVKNVLHGDSLVGILVKTDCVSTTLEVDDTNSDGEVYVTRHEGVHLRHPIRYINLQRAIDFALRSLGAYIIN